MFFVRVGNVDVVTCRAEESGEDKKKKKDFAT